MALSADIVRPYELGDLNELPVLTATTIYRGAAVGDNGSGYARPLVAGDPFRGFSTGKVVNTGSSGDKRVQVDEKGKVQLPVTSVTGVGDVGKLVYASDDTTFTLTAGSNSPIGVIRRHVSGTTAIVEYDVSNGGLGAIGLLTDNSGGTPGTTIAAISGTFVQAEVRNAIASLAAQINAIARQLQ